MMKVDSSPDLDGLARNWRDALAHALSHFSDLRSSDYGFHNRKWILISAHHAAEVFCNYLLKRADSTYPPKGKYPPLNYALQQIQRHLFWQTLSVVEREAVKIYLPPLVTFRDTLMHRPAPEELDVSKAALAILALLILVKRQTGLSSHEFFAQSPPIEMDIIDELRVHQLDAYTRFVERVVREDVGADGWYVRGCDYCGGETVVYPERECRACFHENKLNDDD